MSHALRLPLVSVCPCRWSCARACARVHVACACSCERAFSCECVRLTVHARCCRPASCSRCRLCAACSVPRRTPAPHCVSPCLAALTPSTLLSVCSCAPAASPPADAPASVCAACLGPVDVDVDADTDASLLSACHAAGSTRCGSTCRACWLRHVEAACSGEDPVTPHLTSLAPVCVFAVSALCCVRLLSLLCPALRSSFDSGALSRAMRVYSAMFPPHSWLLSSGLTPQR